MLVSAESVLTMDPATPSTEAVLVRRGVVVAAGSRADLKARAGTEVEHVDLPGATVIPGLVESHVHPVYTAMTSGWADCRSPGCGTIADVQEALRTQLTRTGGWVRGWGYDDTLLADMRHPTRDDLDAVSTDRPVVAGHISAHFAVANSLALRAAGISEEIVSPGDPGFPRDANGRLTGLLWEVDAVVRVFDQIPKPRPEQLRAALVDTLNHATHRGITTLHDLGVGLMAGLAELELYADLEASGDLPLHVVGYLRGDLALSTSGVAFSGASGPGERFRLAGAKFWADGSIQGLTAALRLPYTCRAESCGELLQDATELARMCTQAVALGAQVAVHANGDAAVEAAISALAPLQASRQAGTGPHRLEHCQVSTPGDLDAIRAAGLGVSFFINHVFYWGDRHRRLFLGADRAANMDALAWARARGLRFGLHSDCPITPMDPLRTIWSAVSRRTRDGDVLGPDQRLDVSRAVQAMTTDSHWLSGDQAMAGALAPGQRADLVAVDVNLTAAGEDALRGAQPAAVMVEGSWALAP
jgi:predicted amidohydrolase YtcJ